MGNAYGPTTTERFGESMHVSADGKPEMASIGRTVDWSTITAVGSDTTLLDNVFVESGRKYIRYGQVLVPIGVAEVKTITLTGGPTAGTATVTITGDDQIPDETIAIVFNATAAAVQTLIRATARFAPEGATVTRTGAGSNGDPYIYTFASLAGFEDIPDWTATHTFTGGTTPTVTFATSTAGTGGKIGPYDFAATDGRQTTVSRGKCFISDVTVLEDDPESDFPPLIVGGRVWKERIIATSGTHSLAAGPTFTELEAAMPRLSYVFNR